MLKLSAKKLWARMGPWARSAGRGKEFIRRLQVKVSSCIQHPAKKQTPGKQLKSKTLEPLAVDSHALDVLAGTVRISIHWAHGPLPFQPAGAKMSSRSQVRLLRYGLQAPAVPCVPGSEPSGPARLRERPSRSWVWLLRSSPHARASFAFLGLVAPFRLQGPMGIYIYICPPDLPFWSFWKISKRFYYYFWTF